MKTGPKYTKGQLVKVRDCPENEFYLVLGLASQEQKENFIAEGRKQLGAFQSFAATSLEEFQNANIYHCFSQESYFMVHENRILGALEQE